MNILISVNKNYLDKAETMLFSLRQCVSEPIVVFLLNHALDEKEIIAFERYLSESCHANLQVIDVISTALDSFPIVKNYFSVEMFYRILAQFLLPDNLDRVLWLDADLIVMKDITSFYHQSFDEKDYIVCADANNATEWLNNHIQSLDLPQDHVYFNSGVMLMNLERLRQEQSADEIIRSAFTIRDKLRFPDQDILNYIYAGRVKYCDWKHYNYQMQGKTCIPENDLVSIFVLHYTGSQKPWNYWQLNGASKYWWRVKAKQGYKKDRVLAYYRKIKEMTVVYFRELKNIL